MNDEGEKRSQAIHYTLTISVLRSSRTIRMAVNATVLGCTVGTFRREFWSS